MQTIVVMSLRCEREAIMCMGLREANQQFSRLMKAVRAGKEVWLTERGRPLAVVRPIATSDATESTIQRLESGGILRPASKRKILPPWKPREVKGIPTRWGYSPAVYW